MLRVLSVSGKGIWPALACFDLSMVYAYLFALSKLGTQMIVVWSNRLCHGRCNMCLAPLL